jgi:endonuclease/exonuclease/phosphatase family metal-dependent hydrolase
VATFPAATPARQLDHVLVDGDVRPLGAPVALHAEVSDHRPLVVDVAVGTGDSSGPA